jgi:DNA primase
MIYSQGLINKITTKLPDTMKKVTNSNIFRRNGVCYVDKCPFCGEQEVMYIKDNEYYCYACGEGGNVIHFIMKQYKKTFVEAVTYLADIHDITIEEPIEKKPTCSINRKAIKTMEINRIAAKFYFQQLRSNAGKIGMNYFASRDIPERTKNSFGLGYAGNFGDSLYRLLKDKGYSDTAILDSGLVSMSTKPDAKNPFYDKFWNRVIFPIFNEDGEVVAFGGRVLDDSKPKYLNSPETAAYTKGDHLFAFDKAKKSKHNYFICCEGYMDAMTMHQYGFDNAVASLGTALTKNQIELLSTKKMVILAYDSDMAGINATKRAIALCRESNLTVKVLQMKGAKDPDEFLKKFGSKSFEKLIANAESDKHFLIRNSLTDDKKINFHVAVEELL